MIGGLFGVARWLEMLSLGVYVFETTASPFLVALLIILRMTPLFLFGAFIGALADRIDPKALLIVAMATLGCLAAVMFFLFFIGVAEYWHVAVATFISGSVWALDVPVRRQMLGDIAGLARVGKAMGLDSATNNATRMLGPLIGGFLFQWLGVIGSYGMSLGLIMASSLLVIGLKSSRKQSASNENTPGPATSPLQDLMAGLHYVRRDHNILCILGVTIVFNIWGFPFMSMLPVLGKEVLGLTPSWIGALSALEGAGAFLGALIIAAWASERAYNRLYYVGTVVYLALVFLLGWFATLWATALILFLIGLAIACFSTMQSTLVYLAAPDGMRGRIFGLLVICIGTGLLGFTNVGLMAESFGAQTALKIIASEGIVALLLVGLYWRKQRPALAPASR
jgi:MFS family permease